MISIENKLADIRKARQSSAAPAKCGRIPFNKPSLVGEEINNIFEAIELGQLSGDGHFTDLCNQEIARITDASTALLTHSCTAALEMAAILCELGPGDEVIMPSFTFVSTANAVVLRGAVPVFVDIDPMTLNIDPAKVEAAVTPATRAIFAVHYAGFPADMDALARIARENDLVLVEDAAQALGSFYKGRPAGSLADIGAISFHETKNIISGEGGAITINRPDFMKRAEIIREKGTNRSQFIRGEIDKYSWVDLGSSMLPGELIAAFLFGQLSRTDAIIDRRRAIFDTYMASFADLEASGRLRCPKWSEDCAGNGHMFYLLLDNAQDRQAFIRYLGSRGITAPFHYVPLHSAPAGRRYARHEGHLAVTDDISQRLVRLPVFYELGHEIDEVIERSRHYLRHEYRRAG